MTEKEELRVAWEEGFRAGQRFVEDNQGVSLADYEARYHPDFLKLIQEALSKNPYKP